MRPETGALPAALHLEIVVAIVSLLIIAYYLLFVKRKRKKTRKRTGVPVLLLLTVWLALVPRSGFFIIDNHEKLCYNKSDKTKGENV